MTRKKLYDDFNRHGIVTWNGDTIDQFRHLPTEAEFNTQDLGLRVSRTELTTSNLSIQTKRQNAARSGLIPVATRNSSQGGSQWNATSDGFTTCTARIAHKSTCRIRSIVLVYMNAGGITGNGNGETLNTVPITVKAAVEYPALTIRPVSFRSGQDTAVLGIANGLLYSDPIMVDIPSGTTFHTRTFCDVAASGFAYVGDQISTGFGDACESSTDKAWSGTVTHNTSKAVTPVAILGYTADSTKPIFLVGDSIAAGSGYTGSNQGFVRYRIWNYPGLVVPYPMIYVPKPSQSAISHWGDTKRNIRGQLAGHCASVLCTLSVNDLGAVLATMQTAFLELWGFFDALGLKVWQTTMTPFTTSSDSWATASNQTVTANEAIRVQFNNWIRSTPAPLTGYFEVADTVEVNSSDVFTRNGGIWKAAWTGDGVHPTTAGHQAMAEAIMPESFVSV